MSILFRGLSGRWHQDVTWQQSRVWCAFSTSSPGAPTENRRRCFSATSVVRDRIGKIGIHPTPPVLGRRWTSAMGHEDAFPRPRLSARSRFSQGTFARTRGNGRDAKIPDLPALAREQRGWSHNGHSELRQRMVGRQKADVRTGLLHALTTSSRELVE